MRLGLLTTAPHQQRDPRRSRAGRAVRGRRRRLAGRARAQAYAHEHGIERAHGSYEELLADPGVDAVYIALPAALHHKWTMRALAAGKHVLVEKPYTRRPEEVDEAHDEAERRGLVLTRGVHVAPRGADAAAPRAAAARGGDPGGARRRSSGSCRAPTTSASCPSSAAARCSTSAATASARRGWCSASRTRVYGEAWLGRGGVDERFAGTLRFGDVVATFQCGFTARTNQIEVVGSEGVLLVPQAFVDPPGIVLLTASEHRVEPGNHYRAELDDFCAAVRGEHPLLVGRAEMRGQARALDALLRSAESARLWRSSCFLPGLSRPFGSNVCLSRGCRS